MIINHNDVPSATPDRWTPVRDGDTYCSPACGARCTKAAHDKAVADANSLAAQLGEGWSPKVWENLGWHYCARKGNAEVRFSEQGSFYEASIDVYHADESGVHKVFRGSAPSALQAVNMALNKISGAISALTRVHASIKLGDPEIANTITDVRLIE